MSEQYSIIMPFLDGSKSFCHGYECGMLWVRMAHKLPLEDGVPIHDENIEQIKLMAAHHGYTAEFTPSEVPGWTYLSIYEHGPTNPALRVIPGGLKP